MKLLQIEYIIFATIHYLDVMKSILSLCFAFYIQLFAFAGSQGNLFITVTGQHYGYPLPNAHITLFRVNASDTVKFEQITDDKGLAKFMDIEVGKYFYKVSYEKLYQVAWELIVKKNKLTEETIVIDDTQPFRKRVLDGLVVEKNTLDSVTTLYDKNDTIAFKAARFKPGKDEFRATLIENTRTPRLAVERKIQGKVMVKAIIDEKGNLSGLYIDNSPNVTLNFNALWAVSNLKEWRPATFNGKPVPSIIEVPVEFFLF